MIIKFWIQTDRPKSAEFRLVSRTNLFWRCEFIHSAVWKAEMLALLASLAGKIRSLVINCEMSFAEHFLIKQLLMKNATYITFDKKIDQKVSLLWEEFFSCKLFLVNFKHLKNLQLWKLQIRIFLKKLASIIAWLNEPNAKGAPKYGHFIVGTDVSIEIVGEIEKVF